MRPAIAMAACALAACGDNLVPVAGAPLEPSDRVVIVAHTDDDLLFAQPDLDDAIARGERVTIVFSTQGIASESQHDIDVRVDGSETVYGKVAAGGAWSCGWITVAQLPVYECKLADRPLALVYLGYPDGGKYGEHVDSLLHLWQGTIPYTWTIGSWWAPIDREQLIATTAEILRTTQPRTIMTGDLASVHGRDHSDHMLTAALTVLAAARAGSQAEVVSYRGYNTDGETSNKRGDDVAAEEHLLGFYWACFTGCGACGTQSCAQLLPQHVAWLGRRYANARRRPTLTGQLALAGACARVSGDAIALGDCATAPAWTFASDWTLRASDGRCATFGSDGTVALAACDGSAAQLVMLDDEGHVWSALPPAGALDYDHLLCLTDRGAELCGADRDVRWTLARASATTDLAALGLAGVPLQLADVAGSPAAELCAATATGLRCALGIGDGRFGAAAIVSPLAVAAESLRFGDVDGDGRADACGVSDDSIVCALAADAFATPRTWLALPASIDVATLALLPLGGRVSLCARIGGVAECAASTGTGFDAFVPLAGAPAIGPLWIADLDGDGAPDWCTADATGPTCATAAGGVALSYGFSVGGVVDGSAASDGTALDPARAALADVDGDGRPELCRVVGTGVACAAGQGGAFGPSYVVAPPGDALVVGDLDGDGRADACTFAGAQLACALSP